MPTRQDLVPNVILTTSVALLLVVGPNTEATEVRRIDGDWIVEGKQTVRGQHIQLDGSLIINKDATLVLEDCTLEILGQYSREHFIEWKGGTLVTKRCTIGGFVNSEGVPIHTVFHLYDGLWEATDTTVQYSYGISFNWSKGAGILRATRLVAGKRPDAIIMSGQADVSLVDSRFPIALGLYVDKGGKTTLDLTPGGPFTLQLDRKVLLPGVNWRLKLVNTYVPRWFLFVRQIGQWHPPAEIVLTNSKNLIVSLLGHNLTGKVYLSAHLMHPLQIGNVTLRTVGKPADISMYALYFTGEKTDVTVTGRAHICELMHRGGKAYIYSQDVPYGISIGCTTLELGNQAILQLRNVHLGQRPGWKSDGSMGEVNVVGQARLVGTHISIRDVRFRTEDDGTVLIRRAKPIGKIERCQNGGPILIDVVRGENPITGHR